MTAFLSIALAFSVACVSVGLLIRAGGRLRILDHPGDRSLHHAPVPRTGGLGLWAGWLSGAGALIAAGWAEPLSAWLAAALLIVGTVSLFDDVHDVQAGIRLIVHALASGFLVLASLGLQSLALPGGAIELGAVGCVVLTIVFGVWMINLYNFMDGIDGLAGGMAVFGFGTLGLLGWMAGDADFAALCWVIAAAAGGFLVWNLPPARIFMGDTGSSVLGLLAAALSLYGDAADLFPLWIAMLAFSPFIVDATVTLMRRTLAGERVWEPHRDHYYQRLVQIGWGHRRTMSRGYVLMAVCCGAALLASVSRPDIQWAIIAAVTLLYAFAIVGVRRLESQAGRSASVRRTDRGGG